MTEQTGEKARERKSLYFQGPFMTSGFFTC